MSAIGDERRMGEDALRERGRQSIEELDELGAGRVFVASCRGLR
jgi:hypothetical protein